MKPKYEIGLYAHNARAYEKTKAKLGESNRTCIIQATGTGKSFVALQLMYDFIKENSERKIYFVTPLSGIKEQMQEHINEIKNLNEEEKQILFDRIEFVNYQALITKSEKELKDLNIDLLVLDEFHHLGAREWTRAINIIIESNPSLKVFGMSATSVRNRGKSDEEDVSETFFEGSVANRYELEDAIAEGVLPAPNYHAALAFLEDECLELEERIKGGKSSFEEKQEYEKILNNIKKKISLMDDYRVKDIIKNYIKPNGKYIYFCPLGTNIKGLQDNFIDMLPESLRDNVEFYQVHSSDYTDRENKINHTNFYHNISYDGSSSKGKIRVMFSINMYNEGIHVPDIDGVIMGRNTESEIVFYQQLGRALAVKKKSDNDENVSSPLVIDLMDNFRQILKLYRKVERQKREQTQTENKEQSIFDKKDLFYSFGISEETLDILEELEKVNVDYDSKYGGLSFEEKLDEVYEYLMKDHKLPTKKSEDQFSDGTKIGIWLSNQSEKIEAYAKEGSEKAIAILKAKQEAIGLSFEEKIDEAYEYLMEKGELPTIKSEDQFSDGTKIGIWLSSQSKTIEKYEKAGNEKALAIVNAKKESRGLSFEDKLDEVYEYLMKDHKLPTKKSEDQFSDGTKIGIWLSSQSKTIEKYEKAGNEKALAILKAKQEAIGLSFEEKLDEAYEYLTEEHKLPTQKNEVQFSDGVKMGSWLSNQSEKIEAYAKAGNEKAIAIVNAKKESRCLSFEDKLDEVYEYLMEKGKLPKRESEVQFSDGVKIGKWLSSQSKTIEKYAKAGNEKALAIVNAKKESKGLSFEEKLDEAYEYLMEEHKLPTIKSEDQFSDGTKIGIWLSSQSKTIEKYEKAGNEKALAIVNAKKESKGLNFEEKIDEFYEYLMEKGKLPKWESEVQFSDGVKMGTWLYGKSAKTKLLQLKDTSEKAKTIVDVMIKNKPDVFNSIIKLEKAKAEFDEVSSFTEVSKKLERSIGIKENTNGRKI